MNRIGQDYGPKTPPLKHQIEAIDYLVKRQYAALFDEQGLGKTKIVIDALSIAMKNGDIQGALIVAPLSLLYNWEKEVRKHSHLIPIVLRGSKREKKYNFLTGANFYVTNYETITSELERIKRFCKSRLIAIVLDEAARIKDPRTKTAKALFELAPITKKRIIVTGTPVANKPYDVWALYYFLDQGKLFGDNFDRFRSEYSEKSPDYLLKLEKLKYLIMSNSIRRKKDDVLELPEKVFRNVYVNLSGRQLETYNKLREELIIEISDFDGNIIIDESESILKKLLRLNQIASNPQTIDSSFEEIPAKYPVIKELVQRIVNENEKAIIWTSFIGNVLSLQFYLNEYSPLVIYGDVPIEERENCVENFQKNDLHKILIANPAAAREGLTLTRANNAIYADRSFNLVDYLQSQDRIHRISQNKPCYIYKLIARNTIDEYIDRIIELKSDIAKYLEGDVHAVKEESINILVNKQELLRMLGG